MIDYNNYAKYYSNVIVFAFEEHLVGTGLYLTHLPSVLYILSLKSFKGGAWKIRQLLPLHTLLNKDAKPKPNKIDITVFPVWV